MIRCYDNNAMTRYSAYNLAICIFGSTQAMREDHYGPSPRFCGGLQKPCISKSRDNDTRNNAIKGQISNSSIRNQYPPTFRTASCFTGCGDSPQKPRKPGTRTYKFHVRPKILPLRFRKPVYRLCGYRRKFARVEYAEVDCGDGWVRSGRRRRELRDGDFDIECTNPVWACVVRERRDGIEIGDPRRHDEWREKKRMRSLGNDLFFYSFRFPSFVIYVQKETRRKRKEKQTDSNEAEQNEKKRRNCHHQQISYFHLKPSLFYAEV